MRQSVGDFVRMITKTNLNEQLGTTADKYSPLQVLDLIRDRYEIVFGQEKCRNWKLEMGENGIEEMYQMIDTPWVDLYTPRIDKSNKGKECKKLLASWPEGICSYLETLYLYIINKK